MNYYEGKFTKELEAWTKEGTRPETAGLDLAYALDMQQKRLQERSVDMECEYQEKTPAVYGFAIGEDSTIGGFSNRVPFRQYREKLTYKFGKKVALRKKRAICMYANVTTLEQLDLVTKAVCPSCGQISDITTLYDGCPNCGTRFRISDFYPKVTSFYTLDQTYADLSHFKRRYLLFAILTALCTFYYYTNQNEKMLICILASLFVGAILGYFITAIATLFTFLAKAGQSLKLLFTTASTPGKIKRLLRRYDSNFSYAFFVGKVLNLLKLVVYSDDLDNLPAFCGDSVPSKLKNIVNMEYAGAIKLLNAKVADDYCYLDIRVFMQVDSCQGKRIKSKTENFDIRLCKNISKPDDYSFSMRKLECRSCGASFDAIKNKHCPYCESPYNYRDEDWTVLGVL